jgi:hypothetical protein
MKIGSRASVVFLVAAPFCIGYAQVPVTTLYSSTAAIGGWGMLLLLTAASPDAQLRFNRASLFLILLAAAAIGTVLDGGEAAGVLVMSAITVMVAGAVSSQRSVQSVAAGLISAGIVGCLLGFVQYFLPELADGQWVARPNTSGRAFGNLRQPNLLGTLFLLGLCCLPLVTCTGHRHRRLAWSAIILLLFGIALTGSRTALLGLLSLGLWATFDRGMSQPNRQMFAGAVAIGLGWWAGLWAYGHLGGVVYFGEVRLSTGSDISSSRFKIWANTLQLIADHPWTGVGWGNFNFAWTLSPFPDRPVAFFDHTHNFVLQLAVELGIPLTLALLALGMWVLWRARGGLRHPDPSRSLMARCCLMMLMVVGWHSMLEYPLWYPYFLFPTAFALGVYLSIGWPRHADQTPAAGSQTASVLAALVGLLMIAGALYAIWDYQRVVQIFAPYGAKGERPLPERIAEGQKSWLFGHHADYAAVTTASRPSEVFSSFERPLKHLVDARLMIAYAKALNELGHRDEAIYVVQRLREFRHPLGEEFLRRCADPLYAQTAFECDTRPRSFTYEDLRVERFLTGRAPTSATR